MSRLPRAIGSGEELTVVGHLEELRARIFVCGGVLVVAIALCFWQNHLLLAVANAPLPDGREPITLSPTEPFMTTLKLSTYGGILLALPVVLFQLYAFLLPAFAARERRVMLPLLLMVPVLFVAGVVFAYYVIFPAGVQFLLNFNADDFNIQIRAAEYYGFLVTSLIAVGILFQLPVGTLAVTKLGIITPERLGANRRYAVLAIAVAAMLLPGTDPVTMLLSMAPLYGLFEISLVLARAFGRPTADGSLPGVT